jgi:hypothetical protein
MDFLSIALCSGSDPSTVAAAPRLRMSPEPPALPPLGETDLGREIRSGRIYSASAASPGRGRRRPPRPTPADCPFCEADAAELTACGPAGTWPRAKTPGRAGYDESRGSAAGTSSWRPARDRSVSRASLISRRRRSRGGPEDPAGPWTEAHGSGKRGLPVDVTTSPA